MTVAGKGGGGVGKGKRRGLGQSNDVLTTCKAVTLRCGQRIIAVFFPKVNTLEKRIVFIIDIYTAQTSI